MIMMKVGQGEPEPELGSVVPAGHVCCCVLSFPLAACTGLMSTRGLQLWHLPSRTKLR